MNKHACYVMSLVIGTNTHINTERAAATERAEHLRAQSTQHPNHVSLLRL